MMPEPVSLIVPPPAEKSPVAMEMAAAAQAGQPPKRPGLAELLEQIGRPLEHVRIV